MIIEGCEISEELEKQVLKRMQMGIFQEDSLHPIVKAFQPEFCFMTPLIIKRIIADEVAAGRIVEDDYGFWDIKMSSV